MLLLHKLVLSGLLGVLGVSLLFPGLLELFKVHPGTSGVSLNTVDAKNQFRALHGMMAGVGIIALWACIDLANARNLVLGLGVIMAMLVIARSYSMLADGIPGQTSWLYLSVEMLFAVVFLFWPPPLT